MSGGPASKRYRMAQGSSATTVGFIGGGNMARSIIQGMLLSQQVNKKSIYASCTSESSPNYTTIKALGVMATTDNSEVVKSCDVIVIAVKPYQVLNILDEIQQIYMQCNNSDSMAAMKRPKNLRPLIVSVAASVTIDDMERKTHISWGIGGPSASVHLPVVRSLPAVSSSVRAGITVYCRGHYCNEGDAKPFLNLFSLTGVCEEVLEKHIDGLSAISGSGVAFMAIILEAFTDAGVLVGLPRPLTERIAALTMKSTALMVLEGKHPAEVKGMVTSPGGSTIAGIEVMEGRGVRGALMTAIKQTTERAKELKNS